ncbi:MAG TPA: hypothetical protein VFU43_22460 [Streptosporangiaceae bacterium]|nr:hypothetical protein [Streptosporangiaceae bacterium]
MSSLRVGIFSLLATGVVSVGLAALSTPANAHAACKYAPSGGAGLCVYYSPDGFNARWATAGTANHEGKFFVANEWGSGGAGEPVRNNAASAENFSINCQGEVWRFPNEAGTVIRVARAPFANASVVQNLGVLRNDNASQGWLC